MISRRHLHLLIALLLPLMVMRGLLPAGYMAVAEDGELRIVMCSAGLAPAGDSAPASDSDDPRPPDAGTCLFAHGSTVAPPVQVVVGLSVPPESTRLAFRDSTTAPLATGPPRAAAARAPPAFQI